MTIIPALPGYTMIDLIDLSGLWASGDEKCIIAWRILDDDGVTLAIPITPLGEPDMDYLIIDPLGNVSHPHEGSVYKTVSHAVDTMNNGE